jgi:hypothetical protein
VVGCGGAPIAARPQRAQVDGGRERAVGARAQVPPSLGRRPCLSAADDAVGDVLAARVHEAAREAAGEVAGDSYRGWAGGQGGWAQQVAPATKGKPVSRRRRSAAGTMKPRRGALAAGRGGGGVTAPVGRERPRWGAPSAARSPGGAVEQGRGGGVVEHRRLGRGRTRRAAGTRAGGGRWGRGAEARAGASAQGRR